MLFYYENKEKKDRPLGVIFLEGSYVERVIYTDSTLLPPTPEKTKDKDKEKEKSDKVDKDKEKEKEKEKDLVDRNVSIAGIIYVNN